MIAVLDGDGPTMLDSPPRMKDEPDIKEELLKTPSRPEISIKPVTPTPKSNVKERSPSTPSGKLPSNGQRTGPQLIPDLPRAEEESFRTFINLEENAYQYKTLGLTKAIEESYQCDCVYQHGVSDPVDACGEGSECINRLTQVECEEHDCRCRSYCLNQRFQRKETANVHVVQTEKKGFGLRAAAAIPKDEFIWEYIGEVVSHPSFMKRMRDYADEGLKHFYFMMLQKDEYIDATKKGGIGRFVNHSCNPNAYVAKWQVGKHLRMGIFAKRAIQKDEELTFNYNVDRYGHDPQPCYCGEPNCVGYLGGKTQTDLSTMDDLYLDALGITDEVEALHLKGSKKKKAKKLDEDFMPVMKPILAKEVPKVIQAMKQTTSKKVMLKLLTRIKMTEDPAVLRAIMRLRAFSVMRALFQEYSTDLEMMGMGMDCMLAWPLQNRNKVDDSKIEEEVAPLVEHENEYVRSRAQRLVDHWATFSSAYRIPKQAPTDQPRPSRTEWQQPEEEENIWTRKDAIIPETQWEGPKPLGKQTVEPTRRDGVAEIPKVEDVASKPPLVRMPSSGAIASVIAAANKAAEERLAAEKEAAAQEEAERQKQAERRLKREEKEKEREARKKDKEAHEAEKSVNKEKRLQKLVGGVVVKSMSKYSKELGSEVFKKHAKEITNAICDKEKKSSGYASNRLDSLSEEKQAKIKKFTKTYVQKLLKKMGSKSATSSHSRHGNGGSHNTLTPASDKTPPDADTPVTKLEVDDMMMDIDMTNEYNDPQEDDDDMMNGSRLYGQADPDGEGGASASPADAASSTATTATLVGGWDPDPTNPVGQIPSMPSSSWQ